MRKLASLCKNVFRHNSTNHFVMVHSHIKENKRECNFDWTLYPFSSKIRFCLAQRVITNDVIFFRNRVV